MEADLHAIVSLIRLSASTNHWMLPASTRSLSHSPTLISSLLFIRPFAASSTFALLTLFTVSSSREPLGQCSPKSATSISREDTLLKEESTPGEVPARVS